MSARRYKDRVNNEDNVSRAFTYLVEEKGLQPHIASGILGNFMQESGHNLDVQAYNPNDMGKPSFGLAQWRADRLDRLKEVAGEDMNTLEGQLDFMMWEFENTEKRAFNKLQEAESVQDAALLFSKYYERPHKDYAHNDKRINNALKVFKSSTEKEEPTNTQEYQPTQEERVVKKDNIPTTPTVINDLVASTDLEKMNQQLAYQNSLILERLDSDSKREEQEETAKSKAAQAQAKLNEKMQQKELLKQLIMNSGAKYVERQKRVPEQLEQYEFENGGKYKVKNEREEAAKTQDNTRVAPRMNPGVEEPIFVETLDEVILTHDKSDYADKKAREQEQLMAEIDRKMGLIKTNLPGKNVDERLAGIEMPVESTLRQEELKPNELTREKLDLSNYKTKEEVAQLQTILKENGYDLGTYGANKDGIDGLIGSKTRQALQAYNKGTDPREIIEEISAKEEKRKLQKEVMELEQKEVIESSIGTKLIRGTLETIGVPSNAAQMAAAFINSDSKVGQNDVDPEVFNHLKRSITNAIKRTGKTKGGTEYIDYSEAIDKDLNSLKMDRADMIVGSLLSPELTAATIFGRVSYRQNPETGEIEIYDTYDFSRTPKGKGEGDELYKQIRHKAGEASEGKLDKTPKLIGKFNPNEESDPSEGANLLQRLFNVRYGKIKDRNKAYSDVASSGKGNV